VLALAGLAGLPPGLAGLFAKVTIVDALIDGGWGWLAAVVAVNAVIALAYYVRATALLYSGPAPSSDEVSPAALPAAPEGSPVGVVVAAEPILVTDARPALGVPVALALWVFAAIAVVLGFAPQLLFDRLTR
jgi:NADH-quinone oxidoreductase subunit N